VTRRLSKAAPHLGELLKDLKAVVARVKEAASAPALSRTAKKKAVPARKKAAPGKTLVKARKAKLAKKVARVKRVVKKAMTKPTAPAVIHSEETADHELMPSQLTP
jgi:hypothetical protein